MSRLDSFIRRLTAQRACLDRAAGLIGDLDGPVLELGLGNGRTYDHLRHILPGRDIFVFERQVAAHPDCIPDDAHLILGDLAATLPVAMARIGRPAALAHADIGSGDVEATARNAARVAAVLPDLLAPGAVVAADQPLADPRLIALALPADVQPGRYHLYRRAAGAAA
ncbi:class I SAM-dependent methyltransferase [Tistrella bauzanensis]|uniref:class I SAM-dependent methyltransferase n=1 Tax=Tistrella TaxID=171436 RepID=UPI0031F63328